MLQEHIGETGDDLEAMTKTYGKWIALGLALVLALAGVTFYLHNKT